MTALTTSCPQCGRELSRSARYCPGCGGKVAALRAAPAKPVAPITVRPSGTASRGKSPALAPPPLAGLDAKLPPLAAPPILPGLLEMRGDSRLTQMDKWIGEHLGLGQVVQQLKEPTILSETAQEFYGALLSGEPLSEGQWKSLLEQQLRDARESADRGGGVWGAFLAGQACLVNGWLFKSVFGLAQVRESLSDPRTAGMVLATVAHEKWGHGFLSVATALGAESRQVHLDRLRYARLFSGFQVTTPEGVILREKWRAVYNATRFAEEGWATWVENLVRQEFASKIGAAPVKQAEWLADFVVPQLRRRNLAAAQQAMLTLFDSSRTPDEAKAAMATLEQAEEEITPDFLEQYGRPPRYVIGYGLCWLIERRFGGQNVPAALMLAGNVVYGLASQGVSDVVNVIAASPDLNVNRRLAAIAHLPQQAAPGLSRGDFAKACHDRLGLSIPANLKL